MTLLVEPPPNRFPVAPDTTGRYPASATVPGTGIGQEQTEDIVVFGRNGQTPNATQAAWLLATLDSSIGDFFHINVNPFEWMLWTGTTYGYPATMISVELRSAAEVATAGAGHGVGAVFAATNWEGASGFPPMDGLSSTGQPASDWPGVRWLRILIREDLATGGAGSAWSGRSFLVETMMHEFGHAAVLYLIDLYGEDYVIQNTCDLFGKPTGDWNDLSIPWGQRVAEANAEFFKDVAFPARRYSSRAAYRLPQERFGDWLELYQDLLYVPYWTAGNTGVTMRAIEAPGDNIGATSYANQVEAPHLRFIPDGGFGRPTLFDPHLFAWPPEGSLRVHWAYDPRPIYTPGFGLWEDLIYVEAPPPGPPNGYNSPSLFATFNDLATGDTSYGAVEVPIWSFGSPPPGLGVRSVMPPPDVVSAVPAEGCDVYFAFSGHTLPKYDLPGDDFLWPWTDWSLRRPRPLATEIEWPYRHSVLTLGQAQVGRIVLPHRVRGRSVRRAS